MEGVCEGEDGVKTVLWSFCERMKDNSIDISRNLLIEVARRQGLGVKMLIE